MEQRDNYDLEKRFYTFKAEYAQLLEERELVKNENLRLIGTLEIERRDHQKKEE